eukprot:9845703-Alexandrium_andersonii.AAC.1
MRKSLLPHRLVDGAGVRPLHRGGGHGQLGGIGCLGSWGVLRAALHAQEPQAQRGLLEGLRREV